MIIVSDVSGLVSVVWFNVLDEASLWTASESRGLEQQVISASLRMNLVRAVRSVTYESHSKNFSTIKIFVRIVQGAQIR